MEPTHFPNSKSQRGKHAEPEAASRAQTSVFKQGEPRLEASAGERIPSVQERCCIREGRLRVLLETKQVGRELDACGKVICDNGR